MNRTQHPSNNGVLGAPAGWDQENVTCNALPITRTEWDGIPAIVSFWRPSAEELKALNEGQMIALWVAGLGMPPVALTVTP